ncbi:type I restriction enzyme EcoR124II R protein, partial [Striga asiatica]
MCCDSSLFLGIKRAASSEALAAVEMKNSKGSVDTADPLAKVSLSDFGFTPESIQSYPSFSVIYSLAQKPGLEFMAGIVKNISRLKSQVVNIFYVLNLAVGDDRFVDHLGRLIVNLLKDEAFHQAFVGYILRYSDQYPGVLALVEAYSMQNSDQERVECLRRDAGLGFIRSFISLYFSSYWGTGVVHGSAASCVKRLMEMMQPGKFNHWKLLPMVKFCSKFRLSLQIDRDKDLYEVGLLSFRPTSTIKWFTIDWLDEEEFYIGMSSHSEHPYPGCSPV